MKGFNKNVAEGLFNPKTVGTDTRSTVPLIAIGQGLGANAMPAQQLAYEQYRQAALGQTPSIAEMQLQSGLEANQRAAMNLAARTRGGNLAGAFTGALGAQTGAMAATNQQAAMLRAQEMELGRAGLAGLGGQMAGQQFGYEQLAQESLLNMRGQDLNYNLGRQSNNIQKESNDRQFWGGMAQAGIGALGSALGAMGGVASDERIKNGIVPTSAADQAAELAPIAYNYDPGLGQPQGRQVGLGAGQVAQSSLGPTLVQQGPDGVMRLDGERAGIVGLAAAGETQRRLDALEQRLMAQQDGGGGGGYYGTAEEGDARDAQGRRMADEIAMARSRHRLGLGAPQPDPFAGTSQMYRDPGMQPRRMSPINPFGASPSPTVASAAPIPSYARSVSDRVINGGPSAPYEPDISPMLRPAAGVVNASFSQVPDKYASSMDPDAMLRDAEQQRFDRMSLEDSMAQTREQYMPMESRAALRRLEPMGSPGQSPSIYRDPMAFDPTSFGDVRQPGDPVDAQNLAVEDAAREWLERTTMKVRNEDGTVSYVPRLGGAIMPGDNGYTDPATRRVENIDRMDKASASASPPPSKKKKDPAWVRRLFKGQGKRDIDANTANAVIEALRASRESVDAEAARRNEA